MKPEVIRTGPPNPSLVKRARKKCERIWAAYRLAKKKDRFRRKHGIPDQSQVAFVMGCQRSGTNMTLWTLDRSMDVDAIEESDPRAFVRCRLKEKPICDDIVERSTAKCVVFKPICDSHRALELYAAYPGSKGVWIYRDYRDVANSAVKYWGDQTLHYMQDLAVGQGDWGFAQWNREKLSDDCLSIVKEAVNDNLTPHGAAALFWYMRNQTFFDQQLDKHPATLLTNYENTVTHAQPEFERICNFLDVRFDTDMVETIFSSSMRKNTSPQIGHRIEKLCDHLLDKLNAARAAAQ